MAGTPMAGSTVVLVNSTNSAIVSSTTTLADGSYSFKGIPAGTYNVVLVPDNGFQTVRATAGTIGGTPAIGEVDSIMVKAGANGTGYVLREVPIGGIPV
jgi:hypothetical protein